MGHKTRTERERKLMFAAYPHNVCWCIQMKKRIAAYSFCPRPPPRPRRSSTYSIGRRERPLLRRRFILRRWRTHFKERGGLHPTTSRNAEDTPLQGTWRSDGDYTSSVEDHILRLPCRHLHPRSGSNGRFCTTQTRVRESSSRGTRTSDNTNYQNPCRTSPTSCAAIGLRTFVRLYVIKIFFSLDF